MDEADESPQYTRRSVLATLGAAATSGLVAGCSAIRTRPSEEVVQGGQGPPTKPSQLEVSLRNIRGDIFQEIEISSIRNWMIDEGAYHRYFADVKGAVTLSERGVVDTIRAVPKTTVKPTGVPDRASKVDVDVHGFQCEYNRVDYYTGLVGVKDGEMVGRAVVTVTDPEPVDYLFFYPEVEILRDSPYIQSVTGFRYESDMLQPALRIRLADTVKTWPSRIEVYQDGERIQNTEPPFWTPSLFWRFSKDTLTAPLRIVFIDSENETLSEARVKVNMPS